MPQQLGSPQLQQSLPQQLAGMQLPGMQPPSMPPRGMQLSGTVAPPGMVPPGCQPTMALPSEMQSWGMLPPGLPPRPQLVGEHPGSAPAVSTNKIIELRQGTITHPADQEALANGFPFVAYFKDAALGEDPVWGALGSRLGVFAFRPEAEAALDRLALYSRQLDESVHGELKALVLGKLVEEHTRRRLQEVNCQLQQRARAQQS